MQALRTILLIVFIIICIALVILVLMQEGKSAGLGAISGAAESYWGKNKGRSMEVSGSWFHCFSNCFKPECFLRKEYKSALANIKGAFCM